MGCDFHWEGTATDEEQRLCGWFLESLFEADEKGVSGRFPESVRCETYYGDYSGHYYELGPPADRGPFRQNVRLVGATIHTGYFEDREPGYRLWATDQLSLLFMPSDTGVGDLVTIEPVADITKPRYDWLRKNLGTYEPKSDGPLFLFRRRGQDRLLANEYWLASLLYAVRKQFMPMLHVSDDYLYFAGVSENDHVNEEFNHSILKPELAVKWGFDFDSIKPTLTKIGASFEKDRVKNLNLSEEASSILSQAEVFSISDLKYWSRSWFLRKCKHSPKVLAEIEDAMRRLEYTFEPESPSSLSDDDLLDDLDEFDDIVLTAEDLRFVLDETSAIEDDEEL